MPTEQLKEATMATITLKNVPAMLHVEIKRRAERNHRSINFEIITCLESLFGLRDSPVEEILAKADACRARMNQSLSYRDVREAIHEGRM